jgi:hypothetical protein
VLRVTGPGGRCDSPRRLTVVSSPARPLDSPYVGLAATGAAEIDRLRRVTARAPSWKTLTEAITPLFERRARTHGVSASLLARTPMSVDWVFASGSDVPDVFYFEASKRIPDAGGTPVEDPIGEVGVVVSGWFRQVNAELVHLASKSELFWGPEEASPQPRLLPLGVLRHGSERVWVMARPGARDAFSLYAVRGSSLRTVLTVEAGQC